MLAPARLLLLIPLLAIAQQEPVFHSGTRLVQVNVVVREKNAPVTGLTKDDFTLLEDGRPRPIATFSVISARSGGPLSSVRPKIDTPTFSNRPNIANGEAATTATILLVDRLNTPLTDQRWANGKIVEFLEKHGAGERIGIYVLGRSIRVIQELTDDTDRLSRALSRLRPQDAKRITADVTVDPTGDAQTDAMIADSLTRLEDFTVIDRVSATRDALEAIARHLAKVPGRKNLIWVSSAFPLLVIRQHEVIDNSKDVDKAARALNDANVAVYPVDPRGLPGAGAYGYVAMPEQGGRGAMSVSPMRLNQVTGPQAGLDTMNTIASLTGGKAFYNTNGIELSMLEAMQDGQVTYVLGFYPLEDELNDRFHKLAVRVNRKGVEVRARSGYFASKQQPGSHSTSPSLQQLMEATLDATEIGITGSAVPDETQAGHFKAHVVVDLHDLQLDHQNNHALGTVDVSLFADGTKKALTITRKIDISEDQLAAALDAGVTVDHSLPVESSTHEIRVVAVDRATGSTGSVRIRLQRSK